MTERARPAIVLPPGRRIARTFVDDATGYEVIEHVAESEPHARPHVVLVDPRTGEVVPVERRAAEIGSGEEVRVDEANQLRSWTRRTIDPETGFELFEYVLTDLATGVELSRGEAVALRPARWDPIAAHLERRALEEAFAREYATWSFEQRATHWFEQLRRRMRWQDEAGLDEYAYFTPENLEAWRAREPEIDRILDAVLLRFESTGTRAEIQRRLGRTPPAKKRRSRRR